MHKKEQIETRLYVILTICSMLGFFISGYFASLIGQLALIK
jgi:hypothetical protein